MFRAIPKSFIVPMRFEDDRKLDAHSLESALKGYEKLNKKQLIDLVLSMFKEIINLHLNTKKCLSSIKKYGINGMSIDQIIDMHLDTANEYFNFHYNGFGCGKYIGSGISDKDYNKYKDNVLRELRMAFNERDMAEIKKFHMEVLRSIFTWIVDNVRCFSSVSEEEKKRKLSMHLKSLGKIFDKHITILGCK